MKKRFFIIILFTLFLTACGNSKLNNIQYDELKEKVNNKETFVLYISTNDNTLEKTLNSILETYDFKAYQINIDKLSDQEKTDLKLQYSYEDPSIIFIIEGKDPTTLSHVTDINIRKDNLIQRLKDMHFIEEK